MDWDEERLPSRMAQHSSVGMAIGRKNMADERQLVLRKRQSKMQMNQVSPEIDLDTQQALQKHGLNHLTFETEDDVHKALKIIRSIPRPMAVRRNLAEILLKGKCKKVNRGFKQTLKVKWRRFKDTWQEFTYTVEVWRSSMKKIEGHQGSAVLSYFVFLRSIFFLNIFLFLFLFWLVTFFQLTFSADSYSSSVTGSGSVITYVPLADTCSAVYEPNVTSDALSQILNFFQGTGWMENTALFYGYYTNKVLSSGYNMPLAYFLVTVCLLIFSLVIMVHSTLSNFKETALSHENNRSSTYCNATFGMDFSIDEEEAMKQLQKSISHNIRVDLDEQRYVERCKSRSMGGTCWLYTKRFFINLLIVIMLCGAGAAIYYAQQFSSDFTTSNDKNDYNQFVFLAVEFLPGMVIGVLNGLFPLIFEVLVAFEDYRPAFVIKISLVRAVFLRLASLAVVVISLYIQITCTDQTTCLVGLNDCPAIQCWETYVGSSVYKLVVIDFIIDFIFIVAVELPRKLVTTKCDCGIAKKVGPAVFDIPKSVLDLVYGQTLCWLGFFFSPLLPAVCVFKLFFLFYLKKLSALYNTVPPEKPYKASKLNSFFMIILMVAYFLICIPLGYVLMSMTPSPMCGPFRIYKQPKDIIDVQISNAKDWFQTVWAIVTSGGVVGAFFILLILAVYYCSALNSAHKDLADLMKEQLVMEGKDKQFLLNRVNQLTGKTKKKHRRGETQLNTVNETKQNGHMPNQNGVTTVQYQAVKLYGEQHETSFVQSSSNEPPIPPADYDEDWGNDRHPGPYVKQEQGNGLRQSQGNGSRQGQGNDSRQSGQGNSSRDGYNQGHSNNQTMTPVEPPSYRNGNVTSVSQVQPTTVDDW